MSLRAAAIRLAAIHSELRPHLLPLLKESAFYRNDPRWIIAKYPGVDKKGNRFRKGDKVLYWPSTKEVMAGDYAEDAWHRFESEKGDEEGMPYARGASHTAADEEGPDVGGMLKALAETFEKASKEKGVTEEDSKGMLNAFEKLLKTLPKDVQEEAREAAAAAAKKKSGGNLMRVASPIFLVAAAAAAASASKHPPEDVRTFRR